MRLFRLHPADWVVTAVQVSAPVLGGSCSGCMTYLAAPRMAPDWPGWGHSVAAALVGLSVAQVVWGGLLCARIAGERAARRANPALEARDDDRVEPGVGGGPVGGLAPAAEPVGAAAVAAPVLADEGSPEWRAAVRQLAEAFAGEVRPEDLGRMSGRGVIELVDVLHGRVPELDAATAEEFVGDCAMVRAGLRPVSGRDWRGALSVAAPVRGREHPGWGDAVRRLARALLAELRPEDGNLAGRGNRHLVEVVRSEVPELAEQVVDDFVRDYMAVRAGQEPKHGWRGPLGGLAAATRVAIGVDLVAASRRAGLTEAGLRERLEWLGLTGSGDALVVWLLAALLSSGKVARLDDGRYVSSEYAGQVGQGAGLPG